MPELLFHGAAREVTGSMHMLRVDGQWVALDCGLFQGHREEVEAKNRQWPLPPAEIAAVVVSHAHTDHTGRLPRLVREGFDGPIFATSATRDLCAIMLADSAHIQMEDTKYVNKKRQKKGLPPVEPLYEPRDAVAAIKRFHTVEYDRWFQVVPGLLAYFHEAGHMLGSAGVQLALGKRDDHAPSIYFTGDLGSPNKPILRDPANLPPCDLLICESTYGGRVNESVADAAQKVTDVVRRTYERGGKVIIPAFSVGRTQTIMYYLSRQMESGAIPRHPVFIDSPLAIHATDIFKLHPECYDEDALAFQSKNGDLFGNGYCTYVRDVEESMKLNRRRTPCTIIAASGMCEAGRIRHHLKNNIENPKNTILIPGYQAENTLGRKLVDGAEKINLFHEAYRVRAEIVQVHGFSGHADQAELLHLLSPLKDHAKQVYLVHGEAAQGEILAAKLHEQGFPRVELAQRGRRISL